MYILIWTSHYSLNSDGKIFSHVDAWLAYSEVARTFAAAILKGALKRLCTLCCNSGIKQQC